MKGKKGGGRPPSRPVVFKDGFYIEVRNRGTDPGHGIKLRKATRDEMLQAAEEYRKTKLVVILGEYKNGEQVSKKEKEDAAKEVKKEERREEKRAKGKSSR
jgi:hypothetical protein